MESIVEPAGEPAGTPARRAEESTASIPGGISSTAIGHGYRPVRIARGTPHSDINGTTSAYSGSALTMPSPSKAKTVIIGAGPVGALAALYAAAEGGEVEVYELRGGAYAVM